MIAWLACAAAFGGAFDALPSVVGEPGQPPEDATVGDLDGDGASELVVAIPSADVAGHEAGAVAWVPSPQTLAPLAKLSDEALVLVGEQPQDRAGAALVVPGDLDGDGYADLAVGAPDATTADAIAGGKVYVVYGAPAPGETDRFDGGSDWGHVGERLFAGGDPDGNGTDDLLVGSPTPTPDGSTGTGWLGLVAPIERGAGRVLALRVEQMTGLAAAWQISGTGTLAGRSAAVAGDGRVILGAPGVGTGAEGAEATRGSAYVFLGPTSQPEVFDESSAVATIAGANLGDAFPWSIEPLADGVLFAVPEEDLGRGAVYVFDSLADGTTSDATRAIRGASQGDLFGRGVGVFGEDLLVGAPGAAGGIGSVILWEGSVALGTIDGCWSDGEVGHTVRGAGSAFAITAPFASVYGPVDGIAAFLDTSGLAALDETCTHGDATVTDDDGDGSPASLDCDDAAAWRHPQALEVCGDGVDDDCDGEADEDCGPPLAEPGCPGCASGPGSGALVALLALALVRRRTVPLLLLPIMARAQSIDALETADHRLWGSAANEYLHGPVTTIDGGLGVANFQGIQQAFAVGEVALVGESLARDVLLAGAPVTLHGSSEHDYFGVSVLPEESALVVGIDHSGLTENDAGEVALFLEPWDAGATASAASAALRLEGEHAGDSFGTVLDDGDLDGDGTRDLVVGAPTFSYGRDVPEPPDDCVEWATPTLLSGAVYVVHRGLATLDARGVVPIAVREHCAPDAIADESIATAAVQAFDPDEATFFGARVLARDLDGDGYGDLVVTSWGAEMRGTVSFFPGPIFEGDLALGIDDAQGALSGQPASYAGWALDAQGSALAVGSQDDRLWIVDEPPSGQLDLGAATATGDPGSGFATALAWGPALLVGAPFAGEVQVLDGAEPLSVLDGAPSLGTWVGWIDGASDGPRAVLTAPSATRTLEHQGVALILDGTRVLEPARDEAGCGCAHAPAAPLSALVLLLAFARRRYSGGPPSPPPPPPCTPDGRDASLSAS